MGGNLNSQNKNSQILIVDDNMFNLTSLQTMIRMKFNINSTVCSSGQISLEFIEQRINLLLSNRKVEEEEKEVEMAPIQIIFMDCNMP